METITNEQQQTSLEILFDDFEPDNEAITINSPTSDDYKKLHFQDSLAMQRDIAEYAEAYISLGKFFVG